MKIFKLITKFVILIIFCILVSISQAYKFSEIFSRWNIVTILFIILGFSLASYTFLIAPLDNILNRAETNLKNVKEKCKNLLLSMKYNIIFMFWSVIIIVTIDLVYKIDIPIIRDTINVYFIGFYTASIKHLMLDFFTVILSVLSIYSFYDTTKALFVICQESTNNK